MRPRSPIARCSAEFGSRAAKAIIEIEGLSPGERDEKARLAHRRDPPRVLRQGGAAEKKTAVKA